MAVLPTDDPFSRVKDKEKLVRFREAYRITGTIAGACRETKTSENTARKWRDKGLLDLDNLELQARAVVAVGPETVDRIIKSAAENLLTAQQRVADTIHLVPAGVASSIATQQFNIFQVARGQATEIHEFVTAEQTAARMNHIFPTKDVQELEGEAVEIGDAA